MSAANEPSEHDSEDTIRTFICIEIPQAIKTHIEDIQHTLRQPDAQISWVKPANIHLTIKFLGDVEASRIETVRCAVERATASVSAFDIEVGSAGCFPDARNVRVLWVGLSRVPEVLSDLHQRIEDELARDGFPRESKRFSPHLTIGRARNPNRARQTAETLIARGFAPIEFQASEIIVMRSDMHPTGSIYTPQAVIHLG
jgi:2'-5' RNA ligase